jgi:hypothetical protein
MSRPVTVAVICEGSTEQTFIREVLAPTLATKNLFLEAQLIGSPGHKGGHVVFQRALTDIEQRLKQRRDIYVSTMFDLYRIDTAWPGVCDIRKGMPAARKAELIESRTLEAVEAKLPNAGVAKRFIPFFCLHEFEALLFSSPTELAGQLQVEEDLIANILRECGTPEEINDHPQTAPSKRIESLYPGYRKIVMGRAIAQKIGVRTIRKHCPHFDSWINRLEALAQ